MSSFSAARTSTPRRRLEPLDGPATPSSRPWRRHRDRRCTSGSSKRVACRVGNEVHEAKTDLRDREPAFALGLRSARSVLEVWETPTREGERVTASDVALRSGGRAAEESLCRTPLRTYVRVGPSQILHADLDAFYAS